MHSLLIAQSGHEAPVDHRVALIIVVLIAVVGALAYGLVRLVRKRRARAPSRHRDAEKNRGLGA